MDNAELIYFTLILCGAGVLLIPFLPSRFKSNAGFLFILINAAVTSVIAVRALGGMPFEIHIQGRSFFNDVVLEVDPLSAWFMLVVNLTCVIGSLYGTEYMKPYENQEGNQALHWIMFVIFHTSMLWVCMLRHGLAFLVAWEIMSVSSLLLLMFEYHRADTLKAGVNYLVQMHIAVVFLSIAFIQVYFSEGTFDFSGIASFFHHHQAGWLFLVFFLGFGIKAGFIPLHTWLPVAHPAGPSHVSGVLSGVIVKLGIYGILRIASYMNAGLLITGELILILSVLTACYGILNAAVHRDFKRMLAFCTIENIGIVGIGIGLGMTGKATGNQYLMFIGYSGALLHVLNHSLYKSLLFFTAGNIYFSTHTQNMERLGGLIKKMPQSAFFFLAGALAIGGLPPFNGFISKFLLYSGLIKGIRSDNVQFSSLMILCISGMAIAGSLSLLTFTKTFGTIFLGSPRAELARPPREVPLLMRLPLFIIIALMLIIGIFPNLTLMPAFSVAAVLGSAPAPPGLFNDFAGTLSMVGMSSAFLIALVMMIYLTRKFVTARRPLVSAPTWGCGYVAASARMQYTGKSFSKTLARLFSFIVIEKKHYRELDKHTIFPEERSYRSNYVEFFETRIIDKMNNFITGFFSYFSFIHNGRIQMYILYGFFFIVTLILATLFKLL